MDNMTAKVSCFARPDMRRGEKLLEVYCESVIIFKKGILRNSL